VVADAVYRSLREPVPPTMYVPLAQFDDSRRPAPPTVSVSVRAASGPPALLARSVSAAIGTVNPDLALTFRPLSGQVNAPLTLVASAAVLATVGGVAGWLPARRASRIDPAQVLRDS